MDARQLAAFEAAQAAATHVDEQVVGGYTIEKTLGVGSFGRVVLARGAGGERVAIKLLPRGHYVRSYHTYVVREVLHHASLRHPFVVALHHLVLTQHSLGIVMEFAAGGNLLQLLQTRSGARLPEQEARWFFQQLMIGLAYCHERGVANRDLKLENLLLDRQHGADGAAEWPLLKICDFGYSKHELNSTAKTGVGTPVYMAPEVIAGAASYNAKKADIWSAGVILFTLLCGRYPFDSRDPAFARHITAGRYEVPQGVPLSVEATELLAMMLQVDPTQRADVDAICAHAWYRQDLPDGADTMNGWYVRHAPDLDWCVPIMGSIIQQATTEGKPGEAPIVFALEPAAAEQPQPGRSAPPK